MIGSYLQTAIEKNPHDANSLLAHLILSCPGSGEAHKITKETEALIAGEPAGSLFTITHILRTRSVIVRRKSENATEYEDRAFVEFKTDDKGMLISTQ